MSMMMSRRRIAAAKKMKTQVEAQPDGSAEKKAPPAGKKTKPQKDK